MARTTAYHVMQMKKLVIAAIQKPGFSLVEVMTPCPTHFGRRNYKGQHDMMLYFKDHVLPWKRYEQMPLEEKAGYMPRGVFADRDKPDFLKTYRKINNMDPDR